MALRGDTVWEVRTTGSQNNGGGFSSFWGGTDYSQQDSAQLAPTDLAMIYPAVTFVGVGLNDLTLKGVHTADAVNYKVEIDGVGTPDTFKWSDSGGATWNATLVAITGSDQPLNNGVVIIFGATTGHTLGDYWTWTTTLNLTSATGGFISGLVGNNIKITAGTNFIVGYYQITTYVDTNTIKIDRTAANLANASAGTGYIGGAANHPQTVAPPVVAGNRIWIKNGTYTRLGANTFVLRPVVGGTSAAPICWEGYNVTRGDKPTDDTRPLLDAASVATYGISISASHNIFAYLRIARATQTGVYFAVAGLAILYFCKSSNNGYWGFDRGTTNDYALFQCQANNNSRGGFSILSTGIALAVGCHAHDNTWGGFVITRAEGRNFVYNNISRSNGGGGFAFGGTSLGGIVNNIAFNNTGSTSDGFRSDAGGLGYAWFNNIAVNNGRFGFNYVTKQPFLLFDYNCYFGNVGGNLNNIDAGLNDVEADPLFTDAANANFTLQSTSPCLGKGFPQTFNSGVIGDYQWNIGPDQDDNVVAGVAVIKHISLSKYIKF